MDIERIDNWDKLSSTQKLDIVYTFFMQINRDTELSARISYDMPEGFEYAFGTYDDTTNTLFFNESVCISEGLVCCLFTIAHELRHALQNKYSEKFSLEVQKSRLYAINADLKTAYKLSGNKWFECELPYDTDYLIELYLCNPNEKDANDYAYNYIIQIVKSNQKIVSELNEYMAMWQPEYKFIRREDEMRELNKIYAYIDAHAE
jgi:translation initiation factor 2 beta subunit (eIF-2beta)/eIF-5